jgi:hypothetical protein
MPAWQRRAGGPAPGGRPSHDTDRHRPAGWVRGGVVFSATAMVLVGFFQVVEGLSALFDDEIHLVDPNYLFPFNLTVWGGIHLVLGVLLVSAGLALGAARTWARSVGIVFAATSAVANFLFLPYSPAWSLTIIALDVVVVWALCVDRWDATRS